MELLANEANPDGCKGGHQNGDERLSHGFPDSFVHVAAAMQEIGVDHMDGVGTAHGNHQYRENNGDHRDRRTGHRHQSDGDHGCIQDADQGKDRGAQPAEGNHKTGEHHDQDEGKEDLQITDHGPRV